MSTEEDDWDVPNGGGLSWSSLRKEEISRRLQWRLHTPSECSKSVEVTALLVRGDGLVLQKRVQTVSLHGMEGSRAVMERPTLSGSSLGRER